MPTTGEPAAEPQSPRDSDSSYSSSSGDEYEPSDGGTATRMQARTELFSHLESASAAAVAAWCGWQHSRTKVSRWS